MSNLRPIVFWLNVRHNGLQPSIFVRSFSQITTSAEPLLRAWEQAIRASSVVENWHSVLRPYLAVHRQLSTGMLARLSCWHNHRIAERGLHQGQSPLMRSGLTEVTSDWLLTLGYPPQEAVGLPLSGTDPHPLLALAA